MIYAERYHDFSAGHRVVGHENKCAMLHGHNYRVHFKLCVEEDALDNVGRVLDFGVIKSIMCQWLERNWDHRFLVWERDDILGPVYNMLWGRQRDSADAEKAGRSFVFVPFNPTAENMAYYLLHEVGPTMLPSHVKLVAVRVEETRKCSAGATL